MRIVLLYPPPWKIPSQGEAPDPKDGPPPGYRQGDLDADFYQTPYGLFSLGAQAIRAGHQVKVINLSAYPWTQVEDILQKLDADVYGMSCWTANRHGVKLCSEIIRKYHTGAHIIVGGPHVTPLTREVLTYYTAIDTAFVGESEISFLELLERLSQKESTQGIRGTFYRDGGKILEAPERPSVSDLDSLASPQDYFAAHILMTSRGCPWSCTFCGAESSWGRGFRSHSIERVLDAMSKCLSRLPVKMIQIKDDTFTTNKKRVLRLCKEIRERKLNFFWSCDTRVDLLSDELLREMRLAGCQRLSLGVESGSQVILDRIQKKISVDEIITSTEIARRYGIKARYYMMLGNRGETAETFQETLRFLHRARPHEYIFSCLSVYPGTQDFTDAEAAGWLDRRVYFTTRFQELKTPFDASPQDTELMNDWFTKNSGLQIGYKDSLEDYQAILERLGDYHAAHMDLGTAYYHAGQLDLAEQHVRRALELEYPLPGLVYNHLACIALARRDIDGMMNLFSTAAKVDPQHYVLIKNVNAARAWFAEHGPERGIPLHLEVRHDFQLLERTIQPTLPGPLPENFDIWEPPLEPQQASTFVKTPEMEGSKKKLGDRTRLPIVR